MSDAGPVWIVLGEAEPRDEERDDAGVGTLCAVEVDSAGAERARTHLAPRELADFVAARESDHAVRWVWNDTVRWYPDLLAAGVRVARCHDLRLCHAILRDSSRAGDAAPLRAHGEWDHAALVVESAETPAATLFDIDVLTRHDVGPPGGIDAVYAEFARQRATLDGAPDARGLRLLLAAESAGALIAAELRAAGVPWDAAVHDALLRDALGPRPAGGGLPRALAEKARDVRDALGDPSASLDSQPKLLRSLHRVGVLAESTSQWELTRFDHPVIEPLLAYKKMSRLLSANGWAWLAEWVRDGRFRPVYIPGGVVTGRWASSGGGALQIPRRLRSAVRADPGWRLVIADVAQLEPRVLAALARDHALAEAARGQDLYAGIVDRGAVASRQDAKIAMLGAMYGATTGESGRLVPSLRRAFPRAMGLVDDAARVGEEGGNVSTLLGRTTPSPSTAWRDVQSRASGEAASAGDEGTARRSARDRGRFTRNFVVQGTAAEWALAWLADLRGRLAALPAVAPADAAERSGPVFARRAHLAFFLHDEVIIHAPALHADAAARAVQEAADAAGRLLFGDFPIDFRLDVTVSESANAK